MGVGTEARGEARGDDFENSAQRVAGILGALDFSSHLPSDGRVNAAKVVSLRQPGYLRRGESPRRGIEFDGADLDDVGGDSDLELLQEAAGKGSGGDAGGGFPGAGPFEDVSDVLEAKLQGTGEVSVAWTRKFDWGGGGLAVGERLGGHLGGPILPIAVADEEGDGGAEGEAEAKAGKDFDLVILDAHSGTAAVAELTAGKVAVEEGLFDRQAGWEAFNDNGEGRAVGLASGEESHQCESYSVSLIRSNCTRGRVTLVGARGERLERGVGIATVSSPPPAVA